jgi:hypothetical protein
MHRFVVIALVIAGAAASLVVTAGIMNATVRSGGPGAGMLCQRANPPVLDLVNRADIVVYGEVRLAWGSDNGDRGIVKVKRYLKGGGPTFLVLESGGTPSCDAFSFDPLEGQRLVFVLREWEGGLRVQYPSVQMQQDPERAGWFVQEVESVTGLGVLPQSTNPTLTETLTLAKLSLDESFPVFVFLAVWVPFGLLSDRIRRGRERLGILKDM